MTLYKVIKHRHYIAKEFHIIQDVDMHTVGYFKKKKNAIAYIEKNKKTIDFNSQLFIEDDYHYEKIKTID